MLIMSANRIIFGILFGQMKSAKEMLSSSIWSIICSVSDPLPSWLWPTSYIRGRKGLDHSFQFACLKDGLIKYLAKRNEKYHHPPSISSPVTPTKSFAGRCLDILSSLARLLLVIFSIYLCGLSVLPSYLTQLSLIFQSTRCNQGGVLKGYKVIIACSICCSHTAVNSLQGEF